MYIQYFKHYSHHLGRDMEFKVYGHGGKPVMFIPCQSGRFFDFENFHMIDHWAQWIEAGKCTVFSVDCLDDLAWAAIGADNRWRTENHERWYHYIVDEMVPTIQSLSGRHDIMTFGCSMGGMHAANLFFRRPDLFDGVFAISGVYDSQDFFGDYMDEVLYQNSPQVYLANMQPDHPFVERYNNNRGIICTGQGAWEEPDTLRWLDTQFARLGAKIECDYWGYDVNHDWPWWYKMVAHYVPQLLG